MVHSAETGSIPTEQTAAVTGPGSIWECKIGSLTPLNLPGGADAPMRRAIQKAFYEITGEYAEFTFSGWSAKLTDGEMEVVKHVDRT